MIRFGLALVMGYGVLFGSGSIVGDLASLDRPWSIGLTAAVTSMAYGLIYLNLRGQMWGTMKKPYWRALVAMAIMMVWVAVVSWAGASLFPSKCISAHQAALVGSVALVVSILGQWFFGTEGSVSEPL